MINRMLVTAATFISAAFAMGAVPIGENILVNGRLEADQVDFPQGWTFFPTSMVRPEWHPTGGPGGMPCVTFVHEGAEPSGKLTMRQYGLQLSSNGTYRVSAMVRVHEGFSAAHFWLLAVNYGWRASRGLMERGIESLPPPGTWGRVSATFKGFESNGTYFFAICLNKLRGAVDVADLKLEAVDEDGAAGADHAKLSPYQSALRVVPWGTLLGEIPNTTREVSFRVLGEYPAGISAADCDIAIVTEGAGMPQSAAVDSAFNVFRLPSGADGGMLSVKVVCRQTGSNLVSRMFRYRTVAAPSKELLSGRRRLNNFVSEVLRERLNSPKSVFRFASERRRWVCIMVRGGGGFKVQLDGNLVMDSETPRHETFREVVMGNHELKVFAGGEGEVVVRTMPEIVNYCPSASVVGENPVFDWTFQKKYALPAVTTMNGGHQPQQDELERYRAMGYKWLGNVQTTKPKDGNDIFQRIAATIGMTDSRYDGVTCDEQHCGSDGMNSRYLEGLRRYDLEVKPMRGIYTWLVGKPMSGVFDAEFIAECANVSLGRGMILTEIYSRTRATEEQARAYIEAYACETMRRFRSAYPSVASSMGMVLGNFVQLPVLSLHHHCSVDYKYYLDMQLNAMANDPAFDGVALTGYWGSYYIDEETLRWCFRLMRHYCIDGRRDMLSREFGLTYNPGFVVNPDFSQGLNGWKKQGVISRDVIKGLGEQSLGLFGGADGVGDSFAVFERGGKPNRLSQKISGLVPGQAYLLQFVTFDVDDAKAHRHEPRKFALVADLGNAAEIDDSRSWIHVDRRAKGGFAKVNLNHVVFTAKSRELELSFTDVEAKDGERLGLNWIYFAKYVR